ncbi:extracellular solute-binding protein [Candidatus Villigracilis saccharophilus]|uniref:extracellular solute-binding protein n=1 Tax=Candidatus Villigracilis saccharophilus TaxID=3140684 RepID=UPI003135E0AB|nr:extracellular solute-binding protein [Anaerolineales bacterium]
MKSNRIAILIFSLIIITATILAACAPAATPTESAAVAVTEALVVATEAPTEAPVVEPVTLQYWHTHSDAEAAQLDQVIAAFEAANSGITVESTRYAYSDYKTALLTAISSGAVPDVARLDIAWVSEFADQGALTQLDGNLPDFEAIIADTFPGPLSTNVWQDHYYGMPLDTNTQVLLWNKSVFEAAGLTAAPTTMEEFAAAACQLTDATKKTYGYAEGGTYFWAPAPVFYAMGGKITDEKITTATGYVNGADSVAAFTMLKDLYDQGCLSPNLLGGGIATDAGHAEGTYAMIIDGPWMVDIYKGNYPNFEVNFAPVPSGPQGTTSSVVGGEDVVVLADSQNQEAAMKWAAYLLSPDAQKMMAAVGQMPTLASLVGDPAMPAYFAVFQEQLKTAQARVPHPKWSDMDNAINNAYQRMLKGDQTPQEALDQAATEIDALLGK